MLIAHLSDPHLCPDGTLYQSVLDTTPRFAEALRQAASFAPDLLVLSGALACRLLGDFPAPVLAIPGNHDDRDGFRRGLSGLPNLIPLPAFGPLHGITEGALRVIGLDVTVPGEHHGQVTPDHAAWLEVALSAAPATPTLLVLHQPPYAIGMDFIDAFRTFGEDRLARVLSSHPQVIRLLAGHVHRFSMTTFAERPALTAPAIAASLALRLQPGAEPASIAEPAAFLLHRWSDGHLTTHLQPVGAFPGPYPFF
jgi:3',5'-cyclic-AMP phosphodiesterase